VEVREGEENAVEELHGCGVVGVVEHSGADVGGDIFFYGECVKLAEEGEGLFFGEVCS
jgi:hypothetical protein